MALTTTIQGISVCFDTYIKLSTPDSNLDVDSFYIGERNDQAGSNMRTLIKFDLSSIPSGSVINSAILSIYSYQDFCDNARTLSVYRVKRAWVENQATWNVYSTGNSWGTAGCANTTSDREAANVGTKALGAAESSGFKAITLTAAKVQEMLSGGVFTNNGFLLQVATEADDAYRYYSSEETTSGDGSYGPKLVINYTPPKRGNPMFFQGGGVAVG